MRAQTQRAEMPPVNEHVAQAMAALRAQEAMATEASRNLADVQSALNKARVPVAELAAAQTQLDVLRERRKPLLAAGFLGTDNADALAANRSAIADLDDKVRALAPMAADAASAIPELEARYTEGAAPVRDAGVAVAAARYRLLIAAAERLLENYGVSLTSALDRYLEIVALASEINGYGTAAGLPLVGPEIPQAMTFPAVNIGRWKAANTAGAGPNEVTAARGRLAQRLRELGIDP